MIMNANWYTVDTKPRRYSSDKLRMNVTNKHKCFIHLLQRTEVNCHQVVILNAHE